MQPAKIRNFHILALVRLVLKDPVRREIVKMSTNVSPERLYAIHMPLAPIPPEVTNVRAMLATLEMVNTAKVSKEIHDLYIWNSVIINY